MKPRVLSTIINNEWAMLPDRIEMMLAIASGEHPGLKAVEAERGEELEYSYNARIRDGVAILPVTGPISRYMSYFSRYSGGTSISVLARDFQVALNHPRVHAILFEFNTPGGEVTGTNELANMIYEARGRKPMTARVGGLCCSAGLWLASACGDIVIDETAMLGSIGVYAAYLDTKKADAKNGYREIKIVSSQSPDKCPDPATPEGEKLIQARVDALAQVFVETVARNRDVTVEKVLADFGRGDVRVGQAAIDAGLADRLGSFEEAVAELVSAHGMPGRVGYTGALEIDGGITATATSITTAAVEDDMETCPDHPDGCPEDCTGEEAPDEEEDQAAATAPHNPPATALEQTNEGVDTTMSDQDNGAAAGTQAGNVTEIEQLRAALAATQAESQAATARIAAMEAEARTNRLKALAAGFAGGEAAHLAVLEHLAAGNGGEQSEVFHAYVAQQQAQAEQIKAGGLFKEVGVGAQGSTDSAFGKLSAIATEIARDEKLPYAQAFAAALDRNKALYEEYTRERR